MKELLRLDKFLADMGTGTRSQIKQYIKKGLVLVNGEIVKSADIKIEKNNDKIFCCGAEIIYTDYEYYMLHKPSGVVSAVTDKRCRTVVELIASKRKDLFPVGRLDKDTEGLLIITNDGCLAHNLLSPNKKVGKTYYAKIDGKVTKEDINIFEKGLVLQDFTALPARLHILTSAVVSEVEITIYEGKYHQVKRMFSAIGKEVMYLKRLSMGELVLDPALLPGQYRSLTKSELKILKKKRG